jgi:DNA polymerase-3 subunit gamma/tau
MAEAPSGAARQPAGRTGPPAPAGAPAPLALYRKYRPATFAEVKGQDQVTEPLRQALRSGRVHHAYLFSGPRGCGKTSSARILARSLNCVRGPTPDPCGECESCVALAPSGPGSIDVIEIDAASHGGVDDARELRERAFYAPVSGRFKIYIIDEAHMVTQQGFNALLKLVEEPPPHLKFIFATTEPEKVISTIRSRTHHYPFRLVPPGILRQLLEDILASEGVTFEPAVLPLVVRAGGGSVRDSLSVLDQLVAGSDESGLSYERAVALLGYTDENLLDEIVNAFAACDGASVFGVVNRVIEGGHEPRRFAADLLDRFRDLIVLASVPDAGQSGLLDAPPDRLERMSEQAARFGLASLTRAAEIISSGLDQMRGATSPRLLLELMCAQVLLPSAGNDEKALLARLERLEHRFAAVAAEPGRPATPGAGPGTGAGVQPAAAPAGYARRAAGDADSASPEGSPEPREAAPGAQARARGHRGERPGQEAAPFTGPAGQPGAGPAAASQPAPGRAGQVQAEERGPAGDRGATQGPAEERKQAQEPADTESFLRRWDAVLDAVKRERRVAWMLLSNATVESLEDGVLTVRFARDGDVRGFTGSGCDADLARVLGASFGLNVRIRAVTGSDAGAGSRAGGRGAGQPAAHRLRSVGGTRSAGGGSSPGDAGSWESGDTFRGVPGPGDAAPPQAGAAEDAWPSEPGGAGNTSPQAGAAAGRRGGAAAAGPGGKRPAGGSGAQDDGPSATQGGGSAGYATRAVTSAADDIPDAGDLAVPEEAELTGMDLIRRELGGQIIGEIDD